MSPMLLLAIALANPEPTLVELYSSEGCSSCPPAEDLLRTRAAADPALVVLEFHVDYWNRLGWIDPFSKAEYSERQGHYAELSGSDQVYTPQAIADGRDSFNGADEAALDAAVGRAKVRGKLPLSLRYENGQLLVSGSGDSSGQLWIAVTESGLQTSVAKGENRGRVLQHAPVVRAFRALGAVGGASWVRRVSLDLDPRWKRANLRWVAAVASSNDGSIVALGTTP